MTTIIPLDVWRALLSTQLEALRTILEVGLDSGTATGGTSTTLEDTAKDWGTDQWKDAYVEIVDGTGKGQIRKIASNTSNTITVTDAWTTPPDSTSKYRIFGAPSEVRILESIDGKIQSQSPDIFVKDISVGTDAVQVDSDSTYRDEVIILADSANTDVVYVGDSENQLFPLSAGAAVGIRKTALNLIYVRAASGTQLVHVIAGGA